MKAFDHGEVSRTANVMKALLLASCTVSVTVRKGGFELSIVICGGNDCREFEFRRSHSDRELLTLAESWKTGSYQQTANADAMARAASVKHLTEVNEFTTWAKTAKQGERVQYYEGNLAAFRFEAPRRRVKLEDKADKASAKSPMNQTELQELAKIIEVQTLLDAVANLHRVGMIELVQARKNDGTGASYYAVRK